jgi:hypothetical protein
MKIKAVTAWTEAGINSLQYPPGRKNELLGRLMTADDRLWCANIRWEDIWLVQENPPWKAANARATDRFPTDDDHIKSNIIQHWRTQAAMMLLAQEPDLDVICWLDAGILKQGAWRNNPVTEDHVREFLDKVERHGPFTDIPFPGIEPRKPVDDHGDNWRFVGSTHIWPARFLPTIHRSYLFECRRFLRRVGAVPLDLAIWPAVEENSGLPFRFYQGEYDATQLTGFPG